MTNETNEWGNYHIPVVGDETTIPNHKKENEKKYGRGKILNSFQFNSIKHYMLSLFHPSRTYLRLKLNH